MTKQLLTLITLFISISSSMSQDVVLQREAPLMDENYTIDGTAFLEELDNGDLQMRLSEDYSTPVGPDVRMYLNNSLSVTGAVEIANLSDLNYFNGAMTFDVPVGINIDDYQYVVFYCLSFNQLWASGEFGTAIVISDDICESTSTSSNGNDSVNICPSDDSPDLITLTNTGSLDVGTNYAYLITDDNEILQEVVMSDTYDFEGSSEETQRVYGISYDGALDAPLGLDRMSTTATDCFIHSDANTYLTITKEACPPEYECLETNTSSNGQNTIEICPTDGENDWIELDNNFFIPVGINYAYLITDGNEIVQDVVYTDNYNFEGTDLDEQRVYGINFDGDLDVQFGQTRINTTATECFIHSSSTNYLTILKTACIPPYECQETTTSTTNNANEVEICPTDGSSDDIQFRNNLTIPAGENYAYLITDENQILQEVSLDASLEFEGSGLSTQRVYGINYDGTLIIQIGENRTATSATECFTHSDANTYLTVLKTACPPVFDCLASSTSSAGENSINICYDANTPENTTLTNSLNTNAGDHYAYLITDGNQILQEVVFSDEFSFSDQPIGSTLRAYGIHYDGMLNADIGQTRLATTATGCFEHSSETEFLSINIEDCTPPPYECENSSTSTSNNQTTVSICSNDEEEDIITLQNSLSLPSNENYAYLITDENEILQEIVMNESYNFEGSGDALQRVYGINYDGILNVQIGEIRTATTASECYEHSSAENYLTITKDGCPPPPYECVESLTAATDWASSVDICPTDEIDDIIELRNSAMVQNSEHYAYLITDESEILQEVVLANSFNFEGSGESAQRVYGINYDGTLNPQIGEIRTATTASGCFIHSGDNIFLTINKTACTPPPYECVESLAATTDWASSVDICPTDGTDDNIALRNSAMIQDANHYAYLITDENEILQEVVSGNSYNFEGSGESTQRVYGINFDGTLNAQIGEVRTATTATGCYNHSGANVFLTITKTACEVDFECQESAVASQAWVTNIEICATDGEDDRIFIQNNIMTVPGDNYAFLITDTSEILQEVLLDSIYNFEGTGIETQRVYGISYSGDLNAIIGEDRKSSTATDCYIHSSDQLYITINKTAACATSVNDNTTLNDINIFPNPTSDFINIDIDTEEIPNKVIIMNMYGKIMTQLNVDKRDIVINSEQYASGTYLIQMEYSNQVATKSIQIIK